MKVIVVAVDVGKWPALLHYSFLTQWNKFTEMFSRWPDCTNFWGVIWINSPLHSRSSHLPFPSLFSSHFRSTSLSTHALLNFPSLVFIHLSSSSDLCIPAQVATSSALIGASFFFETVVSDMLEEMLGSLCWFILPVCCSHFVNVSHQLISSARAQPGNRCRENFTVHHFTARSRWAECWLRGIRSNKSKQHGRKKGLWKGGPFDILT